MFDIHEELKKLPDKPGVYLMHDKNDTIIYVGKAINLKNRVRQYFQSSRNLMPKIQKMVSLVAYFEYIVVATEMEALVLECNLIKEHQPKYNTMLKDGKTYPFIKVTVQEDYPRVMIAYHQARDKAKYFGPYTNGGAVKEIIELLRKLYCIRTCNKNLPKDIGISRPCLYHHLKQCKAPCMGYISKEEYQKSIEEVIDFLDGNYDIITKDLQNKMQKASEELAFEEAAEYRNMLRNVQALAQKQMAMKSDAGSERDIIAFASAGKEAVVQIFFVREGKLLGREHFYLSGIENESRESIITNFVKQYYSGTPYIPRELLLGEALEQDEQQLIQDWLSMKRGRKVNILVPKKGDKEHLVELAEKNASMVLQKDAEKIVREEAKTIGAVKQIAQFLNLPSIFRIESFDISNISGFASVGSMVVYENGKQKKNDYRKFRLKWVQGADDYASMQEILTRRFTHGQKELTELAEKNIGVDLGSFSRFPDLIMMDGGKGQVNIALQVLKELDLKIAVCGMVKDDKHRTRGLYYNNIEIPIDTHSEGFQLITRIQDETHRFAIEYHRSLRSKNQVHSVLDDINGIGAVRRRSLMKHFQSLEVLKEADVETLAKVEGMNRLAAEKVYAFFHS